MASVEQLHGGLASFTFLVHGDHILRFARTAEAAAAHRREVALLPLLADAVSFRVPEPDFFFAPPDGGTCMGYPVIDGRPLTSSDDWPALAAVLRELHDFPVDVARTALGRVGTMAEWVADYERLWADVRDRALPVLDADLRAALTGEFAAFLGGDWACTPVLVHRDLAPEHVLVADDGHVVGLIDFEDATVGDPAIDFVGLIDLLGPDRIERLLAAYGRPVDRDRLRCYWWLVPVHGLLHGLAMGDAASTAAAITELRARIT